MHSDGIEFPWIIFSFINSGALLDISSAKIKYNYLIIILTLINF